ncbi:MAG: 3-methyl-2-oxobutanoate hydroxymethyltransferase [Actinomycetota bacterium]|nr:3-methyl-2-oxobutanoate hydroxymethyltransferase [Actinomycetota bacterium]
MLLSSCARAATAAETRYRIDAPIAPARGARVIALDGAAAEVAGRAATHSWANAAFLVCEGVAPGADAATEVLLLRGIDGSPAVLSEPLVDANVVVMVASHDAGAECAPAIGRACAARGIMTAGLVFGTDRQAGGALAALRPYARVLLPSADESDLIELLTALRA